MVYSDDVQEGDGPIFKPFWGGGCGEILLIRTQINERSNAWEHLENSWDLAALYWTLPVRNISCMYIIILPRKVSSCSASSEISLF